MRNSWLRSSFINEGDGVVKKIFVVLRKLISPFRHPVAFVGYAANFDEWFRGRLQAGKCTAASQPNGPTASDRPYDQEHNELADFYLRGKHRGMTKWIHYLDSYLPYFIELRKRRTLKILEIGVFSGGSLDMYKHFFRGLDLSIVGVDIDEECRSFADGVTCIEIGDQERKSFWADFKKRHGSFSLIIDDGGHACEQQVTTFEAMFAVLEPGGVYIVEDIGGSANSRFLSYVCGLLSIFNHLPVETEGRRVPSPVHRSIEKVEAIPGCIVITKRADPDAIQFNGPWIGTSWTESATRQFQYYNNGQLPPTN